MNCFLKEAIELLKLVTPINELSLQDGTYDQIAKHPELSDREIGVYRQLTHAEQYRVIQFIRKAESTLNLD